MTTRIQIKSTAFDAGQPLFAHAANKHQCRIPVGQSDTNSNINGAGLDVEYVDQQLDRTVSRSNITITVNPLDFDDVQVDRWPQYFKTALADLVRKNYIVVERPVATPLTPAAIKAL
jgi:hypothetical protein